jgi:hypothetical protein
LERGGWRNNFKEFVMATFVELETTFKDLEKLLSYIKQIGNILGYLFKQFSICLPLTYVGTTIELKFGTDGKVIFHLLPIDKSKESLIVPTDFSKIGKDGYVNLEQLFEVSHMIPEMFKGFMEYIQDTDMFEDINRINNKLSEYAFESKL